jgi:hypothetical protein
VGLACCIYGREEQFIQGLVRKLEENDRFEDEGVYRRIIFSMVARMVLAQVKDYCCECGNEASVSIK